MSSGLNKLRTDHDETYTQRYPDTGKQKYQLFQYDFSRGEWGLNDGTRTA